MVKSHRVIQQWNHWLAQYLGSQLIEAENQYLLQLINGSYGKHTVLVGVPKQYSLLKNSHLPDSLLITPMIPHDKSMRHIESDWSELPIASGSTDLVILSHTLEQIDNPHQVLAEACRIVKPEGSIIIFGFNPYSLVGLQKLFNKPAAFPTKQGFISSNTVKKWLALADFELIKQQSFLFRPLINRQKLFNQLKMLEWIGENCHLPFGGIYALKAKAKVIPLTPIRLRWKQQLAGVKISIPGHIYPSHLKIRFLTLL